MDKDGNPSVKTADFYDGGLLLPFGMHKGYAFSLLMCLLGGLSGNFDVGRGAMGGQFMQVLNVSAFTPLEAYQQGVRAFLDSIKSIPPAPGFDEVLVPGDSVRSRTRPPINPLIPVTSTFFCATVSLRFHVTFSMEINTFLINPCLFRLVRPIIRYLQHIVKIIYTPCSLKHSVFTVDENCDTINLSRKSSVGPTSASETRENRDSGGKNGYRRTSKIF